MPGQSFSPPCCPGWGFSVICPPPGYTNLKSAVGATWNVLAFRFHSVCEPGSKGCCMISPDDEQDRFPPNQVPRSLSAFSMHVSAGIGRAGAGYLMSYREIRHPLRFSVQTRLERLVISSPLGGVDIWVFAGVFRRDLSLGAKG